MSTTRYAIRQVGSNEFEVKDTKTGKTLAVVVDPAGKTMRQIRREAVAIARNVHPVSWG